MEKERAFRKIERTGKLRANHLPSLGLQQLPTDIVNRKSSPPIQFLHLHSASTLGTVRRCALRPQALLLLLLSLLLARSMYTAHIPASYVIPPDLLSSIITSILEWRSRFPQRSKPAAARVASPSFAIFDSPSRSNWNYYSPSTVDARALCRCRSAAASMRILSATTATLRVFFLTLGHRFSSMSTQSIQFSTGNYSPLNRQLAYP
ncbi:hypothetical protein F5Y15DRAFT_278363 [Xylariaceae sp. FL0016]|nr:hypothetical protein F5Y15DRAFT_278363 [Xylariaceae sp. FL0016]